MNTGDINCRVWAHENTNGNYHWCHADRAGLAGQTISRDEIKDKLRTAPIYIPGSGGVWEMLTCEPNHDGKACEGCEFSQYKGLSHYYDIKQQVEALKQASRRGADKKL